MSKTIIEVETAVTGCGENCPDMEIDTNGYSVRDETGKCYHAGNAPKCIYAARCKRAIERAKLLQTKEERGE